MGRERRATPLAGGGMVKSMWSRWQVLLALVCLCGMGSVTVQGPRQVAAARLPQASPVVTRLVQVQTEDGVRLDGALYTPDAPQQRTVGVVVLHGVGGRFYGEFERFFAPALAAAGYPALAINMRSHDAGYADSRFPDSRLDVRAALDYLAAQGVERVFLVGHSLGSITAAYYAAVADDPRVVAVGLYSAIDDLPLIQRDYQQGAADYDAWVARTRALVAQGEGDTMLLAPAGITGAPRPMTAATWLSWRGPDAETAPVRYAGQIRVPLLLAWGEDDWTDGPAGRRHFREDAAAIYAAAVAAPTRVMREMPGDHYYAGHEGELVAFTLDWLHGQGLDASQPAAPQTPEPYRTELVYLPAADGSVLEGAWYTPREQPQSVAVLTLHGTGGNFYSGPAGFLGPGLAARGYPVLALNRRDHDAGFAQSTFEGGLADVGAGVDFLAAQGYDRVVLAGHSLGTTFASAYVPQTNDARIVGLVLSGTLADLPARTQEFIPPDDYAATESWAEQAVAAGRGRELRLIPYYTGGQLLTSARAFLSYRVAGSLAVPREQVQDVALPLLIVHDSNDLVARREFSEEVAASALLAPTVTQVELRDPTPRDPNAGHSHVGLETETITTIGAWLDAQIGPRRAQ